jgi:hypothetical protein
MLEPLESHPADTAHLEEIAVQLDNLATRAVDQERVRQHTFDPAVDSWEGMAAPELRNADDGLRQRIWGASGGAAWGAVPLRYWAAQVTSFNSIARSLAFNLEEHVGGSNRRETPEEIEAWQAARAQARERWHEAYNTYIEEGGAAAAAMYEQGPTGRNVSLAHEAGVLTVSPAMAVLTATWHERQMLWEAGNAADLVQRIIDAGPNASREDLAALDELLAAYGADPAFAYYFLTEVGPERLLELTGEIALIPTWQASVVDGGSFTVSPEFASLVGSIQTSLGAVLAVATQRRGTGGEYPGGWAPYEPSRYELPPEWMAELMAAGRQQIDIGSSDVGYAPYGYQMLGVLLRSPEADFGTEFLSTVGGDMLDFELEHGGSDIWWDGFTDGRPPGFDHRLNWTGFAPGADAAGRDIAGMDPIGGLMVALAENPDAGRAFFTGTPSASLDGERVSRVDYLLTDRDWIADLPTGPDYAEAHRDYISPGQLALGQALEAATTQRYDRQSEWIVAEIVTSVGQEARGQTFGNTDLIPPPLRSSMANIAAFWIGDLNDAVYGDQRSSMHDVAMDHMDARFFLADIGKDSEARWTVWGAQLAHTADEYDRALADGNPDGVRSVSLRSAAVMSVLDYGVIVDSRQEIYDARDQGDNPIVGIVQRGAMTYIQAQAPGVGTALSISGIPDAIAGQVNGWLAADVPSNGDHNEMVTKLRGTSQLALSGTFEMVAAEYDLSEGTYDDLRDDAFNAYANVDSDRDLQDLDPSE